MHIHRHITIGLNDEAMYVESVEGRISKLKSKAYALWHEDISNLRLGSFANLMIDYLKSICLFDLKYGTLIESFASHACKVNYNYYLAAFNPGKEVILNFTGEETIQIGQPFTSYLGFYDWLDAFALFQILRDKQGVALMRSIPNEAIERADIPYNEMQLKVLAMIQNIYIDPAKAHELVMDAMHATDPDGGAYDANIQAQEYVLYLIEPMIRVYNALMERKEDYFNEQLEDALNLHKEYYDTDKDMRRNDSNGWISMKLLTPAIIAHDLGMNIKVTSDYIPQWMVEGKFETFEVKSIHRNQ